MSVEQMYDAYALPKDPEDTRENHDSLAHAKHFMGRLTLSTLKTLTGSAAVAMARVQRETGLYNKDNPHLGCALHGCRNFPEHVVIVYRALPGSTIRDVFYS